MKFDFIIVGSGLTGSTIARVLADAGKRVVIVERRGHGGGNVHDQVHSSGIRWHTYGPHYFRTNSEGIWKWARRFGEFYKYEARVMTLVDGRPENWPVQREAIERITGEKWGKQRTPNIEHRMAKGKKAENFETACLAMMPRVIYEKFVKGYTEKQWGVPARTLDASLAKRFEVRTDGDTRLSKHKHQGIPVDGYTAWMAKMIADCGLRIADYLMEKRSLNRLARHVVFTGCVDEYFGFDEGKLKYRGQKRELVYRPNCMGSQPVQLNYPDKRENKAVRRIEWSGLAQKHRQRGRLFTIETPHTPCDANNYEYPFPDAANRELAARYQKRAAKVKGLTVCGRLGEYRYLDMDQAIGRALVIAGKLLKS